MSINKKFILKCECSPPHISFLVVSYITYHTFCYNSFDLHKSRIFASVYEVEHVCSTFSITAFLILFSVLFVNVLQHSALGVGNI